MINAKIGLLNGTFLAYIMPVNWGARKINRKSNKLLLI